MSVTKITGTGLGLPTADGNALGGTSNEWSDFYLADGGVIYFGSDQDVTVTHDRLSNKGLIFKRTATPDGKPFILTLQTGEVNMEVDDVLGVINFQAPDEATGSDAILVAAAIQAVSEGDFSNTNNATKLSFMTAASEAAAEKMTLSSAGALDVTGDITGSTINADGDTAASDNAAMGYTSAEGLILTGQGSTNDVTIKNDADADVITIATGGTAVDVVGALTAGSVASDAGVSGTTGTFTSTVDINGSELILDADADTSITADTDDQIDIRIAGADDFQFTANTFTALSGSTIAIASGATIANSGTATGFADFTAIPDGSSSAPSLANSGDTNTGLYFPAADQVGVVVGAAEKFRFGSNPIPGGSKNMIINGAMTVNQRGSTQTSGNDTIESVDRFAHTWYDASATNAGGTFTKDSDSPTGFGSSLKMDVTTIATGGGDYNNVRQRIEGQNLQHLKYGTADALTCTFSFWFKTTITGIYSAYFYHVDATQTYVREFTVASSNTWEFFQVTLPGYTSTAFDNDNAASLEIGITLASTHVTASSNNVWQAGGDSGGSTNQVNGLSSTSNNIFTTGWQFEVGEVATDFAHEDYGTTLNKCYRYLEIIGGQSIGAGYTRLGMAGAVTTTTHYGTMQYIPKRVVPTYTTTGTVYANVVAGHGTTGNTFTAAQTGISSMLFTLTGGSSLTLGSAAAVGLYNDGNSTLIISAEL